MEHQSTQSGALIGSNDDLLTEILLRIPVKSILRFKSVSKPWRRLLSDRSFTNRFDKLSKTPGIFAPDKYVPFDVEDQSPPPRPDPRGLKILNSCNGLLLSKGANGTYYVSNPTTRQFAIIPLVPGGHAVHKTIRSMVLAFHQIDCVHYKLVCVRTLDPLHEEKSYQIQVYSSDTGEWKISIESFSHRRPIWGIGVYWNGAIQWAGNPWCYKIDVEELHPMPLTVSYDTISASYFGESRGHLHVIMNKCRGPRSLHMDVYEMLSDRSGWLFKYQVELDELASVFPEMNPWPPATFSLLGYSYKVVDMVIGEKDEDTFLVLGVPEKLIKYNIHDKRFKLLSNVNKKDYHDVFLTFNRYTEALASL